MLGWANRFSIFCFLDNQDYSIQPQEFECLLAAGVHENRSANNLEEIELLVKQGNWVFGHLSYELKNTLHQLTSSRISKTGFPELYFFVPQILLQLKGHQLTVSANDPENVFQEIINFIAVPEISKQIKLKQRLGRDNYLSVIRKLREHIRRGDCYEINFCQEFFSEDAEIDPVSVYHRLTHISPNPFSALYKLDDKFLICASPERFLTKRGSRIFSQPMKGTIKRDITNPEKDEALKKELRSSTKDQSENVMVVDLVRNDLSRICSKASVKVDELFGIYTYPQVHQMISTISGVLNPETGFSEIIKACFPMGSMTGAPKHRVMQLIEEYEVSARGIFSGSVGYINPAGDFDFNVVIRSIMYHAGEKYLSYQVGSGITFYSEPELEWEECILKGEAMRKVIEEER